MTRNILSIATAIALLTACGGPTAEEQAKMATEATNKAAFEKLMKAWDTGDSAAVSEVLADNFMSHNPDPMIKSTGKQQWLDAMKIYRAANPDMKGEGKVMVADGDWVAGVAMVKGTNTGESMGMPPTNKPWEASGIDVIRFENGKAVEHWGAFDVMKMMSDMGMNMMEGGASDPQVDHMCNPGCKGDKHFMVHGEKGHVCDPSCPFMRQSHMEGGDMKMEGEKPAEEKKS